MKKLEKFKSLSEDEAQALLADKEITNLVHKIAKLAYKTNAKKIMEDSADKLENEESFNLDCQKLKELLAAKGYSVQGNNHSFYVNFIYKVDKKILNQ